MSTKAKALCAMGAKFSRFTTDNSDKTAPSKTSQGRICCSIMLKRAISLFIFTPGGIKF